MNSGFGERAASRTQEPTDQESWLSPQIVVTIVLAVPDAACQPLFSS